MALQGAKIKVLAGLCSFLETHKEASISLSFPAPAVPLLQVPLTTFKVGQGGVASL